MKATSKNYLNLVSFDSYGRLDLSKARAAWKALRQDEATKAGVPARFDEAAAIAAAARKFGRPDLLALSAAARPEAEPPRAAEKPRAAKQAAAPEPKADEPARPSAARPDHRLATAFRRVAAFTQLGGDTRAVFQTSDAIRPLLDEVTRTFAGKDAAIVAATRALTDRLWRARIGEGLHLPDSDLSAVSIGAALKQLFARFERKKATATRAEREVLDDAMKGVGRKLQKALPASVPQPKEAEADLRQRTQQALDRFGALGAGGRAAGEIARPVHLAVDKVLGALHGQAGIEADLTTDLVALRRRMYGLHAGLTPALAPADLANDLRGLVSRLHGQMDRLPPGGPTWRALAQFRAELTAMAEGQAATQGPREAAEADRLAKAHARDAAAVAMAQALMTGHAPPKA